MTPCFAQDSHSTRQMGLLHEYGDYAQGTPISRHYFYQVKAVKA
ncbi:MAG TPA: hypothetical protein VGL38_11915 [bacterium]